MKTNPPSLEILEARIAPAAVFHYNDVDLDKVTITSSKGTNADLMAAAQVVFGQLALLNLKSAVFKNADITFSVVKVAGGDGLANVGYIDATGFDLGAVKVQGDLGRIDAGDATNATPGLKSLTVKSLGRFGPDTQAAGGNIESNINGALAALTVAGDIAGARISVSGGADGTIGTISIGGSLIGGTDDSTGRISATGDIGPVKITRDLQGGSGAFSSELHSTAGKILSLTIGGSLIGGTGASSGRVISNGDLGPVKIGHDLHGGPGLASAQVSSTTGKVASLTIGGSLIGDGVASAQIGSNNGGDIGAVKIGHDMVGGSGLNSGKIDASGGIASVTIGGSLIGGLDNTSGSVIAQGDIGAVKVGHDVIGGTAVDTGSIKSTAGKIASLTIGGSVIGGSAQNTGAIISNGDLGAVKIGHDVKGGSGNTSGVILAKGSKIASVTIGGSLIGGSNGGAGVVDCGDDMGAVKIGHDLIGGSITTGSLTSSGVIQSGGRIASVTIGGSVISGIDASAGGDLLNNATIRAADDIGSLTVTGSLIGHHTTDGDSPVIVSARGQKVQGATSDLAIGKVTIGGRVEFAKILAGYNTSLAAANGDAQIGPVSVKGDWAASDLVAGATDGGNGKFGDMGDASFAAGNVNITAKIASIVIGGHVVGSPSTVSMMDHFGFVAQQIGSFKAAGFTAVLHAIAPPLDVIDLSLFTGDVTIREV